MKTDPSLWDEVVGVLASYFLVAIHNALVIENKFSCPGCRLSWYCFECAVVRLPVFGNSAP
jgi:hypothetical protein